MNTRFEDGALSRFFNVIFFIGYFLVFLTAILAAMIGYGERETVNATVQCKDGTSWDALKPKNILFDSRALCGICARRNAYGGYVNCDYGEIDYSAYDTEIVKEDWSWSTVIYPLIVLPIGFGLVDSIKIMTVYIFSGRIALEKSLLLKLISLLVSS